MQDVINGRGEGESGSKNFQIYKMSFLNVLTSLGVNFSKVALNYCNLPPNFSQLFMMKKLSIRKWQIFIDIPGSINPKIPFKSCLKCAIFGHNLQDPWFPIGKSTWVDGEDALRDALTMEKAVSKAIKVLIDKCDSDTASDYHTADWLTGTWLEEQLGGQRKLAGMINNLNTFKREHEALADWMFSHELLKA